MNDEIILKRRLRKEQFYWSI